MNYGLKEHVLSRLISVFSHYPVIEKAILYGSRSIGNYKKGSDIDIVLVGHSLNLNVLNAISLEIDDLLLPYTIDLSLYHMINNDDLIDHINRVGKIIYQRHS